MVIRKLTENDGKKLNELIDRIEFSIENKKWWLPIKEVARNNFFNDEWTYFLGMFVSENLIAASALFLNEYEYGDSLESITHLDLNGTTAEIGRCMVDPSYRGNNFLLILNKKLIEIAKDLNINNLIATIHPQNIPSKRSFEKLGFIKETTVVKSGDFSRDIYVLKNLNR